MLHRLFLSFLFLCISSNAFATSGHLDPNKSQEFIKKAEIIISELKPLADYLEADKQNLQDEQLYLFREEVYRDYAELVAMKEQVDSAIKNRERELAEYERLLPNEKNIDDYKFNNATVERRYNFLINDLNSLIEAKVYIAEIKELINLGIDKLSEARIETRNRDFFEQDESLISLNAWVKGWQELKANFSVKSILPMLSIVLIAVIIYNLCLFFLSRSFRLIKTNLSAFKDRRVLNKISIFLRLFWCVFVASAMVLLLGYIFNIGEVNGYITYTICIYFIVQNTTVILFKIFGIYLDKKAMRLLRILILVIVCLLAIQGINFFSIANLTPMFGRYGNTILSFILSIAFVFFVIKLNGRMYTGRVNSILTKSFLALIKMLLLTISILYLSLAFIGRDNLATGMTLDVLQIELILVAGYSIYSLLTIWIYLASAKLRSVENISVEVISKLRGSTKELIAEYWLRIAIILTFSAVCIVLSFIVFGVPYQRIISVLYHILFEGFDINGERHFAVFGILKSILILVGLLILSKLIQKAAAKNILPYTGMDIGTQRAIQTAIGYIGIFISLLVFIYSFGIDGTSLAFIISGLSVGFGFAMQDLIKNFFAGLTLLAERPIKVGDWINIHNELGEVKKIRIRSTVIETFNNNTLIIPNGLFMNEIVSNETFNPMSRMVLRVGVSFDSDVQLVTKELLDIAAKHKDIYTNPEPYVIFEDYGEYALRFSLRAYCSKVIQFETESEIREIIVNRFRELGIEIPIKSSNIKIQQKESYQ